MGGNRGSTKKGRSKNWRNVPGSSTETQRTESFTDQEDEHILSTASLETVSSVENVSPENPDDERPGASQGAVGLEESQPGSIGKTRKGSADRRRIFGGILDRTGLCLCVVYQCAGINNRTCELCNPRRMAGYQKMENEQYRADHGEEGIERDIDQYHSLLLNFYLESPSVAEFCPLLVSRGMTTFDAIKAIALNQKNEDHHRYTIVEHWKDYEAERILEDHEIIQDVRREQVRFFNQRFVFLYRSELEKYECIKNKEEFFVHPDSVRSVKYKKLSDDPWLIQVEDPFYTKKRNILEEPPFVSVAESNENVVESSLTIETIIEEVSEDNLVNPIFCGTIYIKQSDKDLTVAEIEKLPAHREKAHWPKKFLLLRDKNLYFVDSHQNMLKCYYSDDQTFKETLELPEQNKKEKKHLEHIGSTDDLQMYSGLNTKRYHNAPYGGGIYLKRHDGSSKKNIKLMFCCKNNKKLSDPNNFTRKLWLAAMRLAKHGNVIKENYLQYQTTINEYDLRMKLLREANNPRVAMDFSYGVGRVVDDPKEAAEIARGEARGSGLKSTRFQSLTPAPLDSLRFGPHLSQGYYHGNLSREQAEEMIIGTGTNGAFIVRDSKNRPGCLVITYMHALRAHHQYVTPVVMHDKVKGEHIFLATCDKDTVFYDVHSLIEYHRLNRGSLQCILRLSVKNPLQPDGTPPRHRKSGASKSRTSSPKAGPSREFSGSAVRVENVPSQQICEIEKEKQILVPLQSGPETNTLLEETPSTKPTPSTSTTPPVDLLTSLEIHPEANDPLPSLSPCPSRSPRREGTSSGDEAPGPVSSQEPNSTPPKV